MTQRAQTLKERVTEEAFQDVREQSYRQDTLIQ